MIINYADVTDEMIANAVETSLNTLRHSISGTDRVILKYEGAKPSCFRGINTYTHSQILTELQGSDWKAVDA